MHGSGVYIPLHGSVSNFTIPTQETVESVEEAEKKEEIATTPTSPLAAAVVNAAGEQPAEDTSAQSAQVHGGTHRKKGHSLSELEKKTYILSWTL